MRLEGREWRRGERVGDFFDCPERAHRLFRKLVIFFVLGHARVILVGEFIYTGGVSVTEGNFGFIGCSELLFFTGPFAAGQMLRDGGKVGEKFISTTFWAEAVRARLFACPRYLLEIIFNITFLNLFRPGSATTSGA